MNRGAVRQTVFRDPGDYAHFLDLLRQVKERSPFRLLCYCLMPNHYHFLVQTMAGSISTAMHWLQTAYAAYFNRKHERSGHVFQSRFQALLCGDDAYLWTLTQYIHDNPVRASLCSSADRWRYSSHRDYAQGSPTGLVDTDVVVQAFPGEFPAPPAVGWTLPLLAGGRAAAVLNIAALGRLLDKVADESGQHPLAILGHSRIRDVTAARHAFITCAHKEGWSSYAISRFLGVSRQAVAKQLPRMLQKVALVAP